MKNIERLEKALSTKSIKYNEEKLRKQEDDNPYNSLNKDIQKDLVNKMRETSKSNKLDKIIRKEVNHNNSDSQSTIKKNDTKNAKPYENISKRNSNVNRSKSDCKIELKQNLSMRKQDQPNTVLTSINDMEYSVSSNHHSPRILLPNTNPKKLKARKKSLEDSSPILKYPLPANLMQKKLQTNIKQRISQRLKNLNNQLEPRFRLNKIDIEDIENSKSIQASNWHTKFDTKQLIVGKVKYMRRMEYWKRRVKLDMFEQLRSKSSNK